MENSQSFTSLKAYEEHKKCVKLCLDEYNNQSDEERRIRRKLEIDLFIKELGFKPLTYSTRSDYGFMEDDYSNNKVTLRIIVNLI